METAVRLLRHPMRFLVPFSILVVPLLAACQPTGGAPAPSPAPAASGPIKIGGLFPYTGALGEFGPDFENGAKLAIKHLKDAGIAIDLVTGDDGTVPTAAVGAARKLVDTDKVVGIAGPAASSAAISVANTVTIPANIPIVSSSATSPLLTSLPADKGKDMVFRTAPSDALQGVVLGRLAKQQGFAKAAVMYVDNPYGQGLTEVFEKAFTSQGGQVVAKVAHPEAGQPSYVAELKKATEGKPDVLIAVSYPEHATVYLKEAIEGNFIKKFLFVDGSKSEDLIKKVGAAAVEGMYGTAPGSAESTSLTQFNDAYKAQYGKLAAHPFVTNTYDAVIVLGLAAYKAQIDGKGVTGTTVRDALRQVTAGSGEKVTAGAAGIKKAADLIKQKKAVNYEGVASSADFDANGDVSSVIEIWQYSGGAIKTVRNENP